MVYRQLRPWFLFGLHLGASAAALIVVLGGLLAVADKRQVPIEPAPETGKAATQTDKILANAEALSREVAELLRKMGYEASEKQSAASAWIDRKPQRSDGPLDTSPSRVIRPAQFPERDDSSQAWRPAPPDHPTGRTETLAGSPEVGVAPAEPNRSSEMTATTETAARSPAVGVAAAEPSPSSETTATTETLARSPEVAVAPVQSTQPSEPATSPEGVIDASAGIAEPRVEAGTEPQIESPKEGDTKAAQTGPVEPTPADTRDVVAKAWALIQQGDMKGGQLALEQPVADGNARAAFLLAATYDPNRHRAWRRDPKLRSALEKSELRPDSTKARELYARAAAAGHAQARARAEALK